MARYPYQNAFSINYAKQYCGKKDNSCGVYLSSVNKSDCAHFLAHCLAAGGIKIENKNPGTAFCKVGLAVRNADIEAELKRLAAKYDNIKEIDLSDAIVGEWVFCRPINDDTQGLGPFFGPVLRRNGYKLEALVFIGISAGGRIVKADSWTLSNSSVNGSHGMKQQQ